MHPVLTLPLKLALQKTLFRRSPVNRLLPTLLVCAMALFPCRSGSTPEPLTLLPRLEITPPVIDFTPDVTAWLRSHAEIKVGIWGISQPPISEGIERGQLAGIDADYLALLESALNVHFNLVHYRDSEEALTALSKGDITLLAVWNKAMAPQRLVRSSLPWLLDTPVLVSRVLGPEMRDTTVTAPPDLLSDLLNASASLSGRNPLERNESWQQDYHHAINAVALGTAEAKWMNRATAHYLKHEMQADQLWLLPHPTQGNLNLSFGVSEHSQHLLRAINAVLRHLPLVSRLRIAHGWGLSSEHVIEYGSLQLSEGETQWLQQHKRINVLVDSHLKPLSFVNAAGKPAGLSIDVLQWLSQHYGLLFDYKIAHSDEEMAQLLMQYPSAIVASDLSVPGESEAAQPTLKQSTPWLITPAILLMNRSDVRPTSMNELSGEKIAIQRHNPLIPWLQTWFPTLQLRLTENIDQAITLLDSGEVHGAVSSLFAAQYYLKQNDDRGLYQALALPARPLNISFAGRGDNPEAMTIVNKALQVTSPQVLHKMAAAWRVTPLEQEQPRSWLSPYWTFVFSAAAVLLVILLSALWIGRLRHAMQRLLSHLRRNRVLIAQLQAARHENQRMLQAHNAFMKSMSHQIRTPINAIIGLLELELRKPDSNRNLRTAYESACELMSLTGDVFDIFRAETQESIGNSRQVNLPSLIQSTVALYRQQAEENAQRIIVINRLKEPQCETDPLLIIRLLSSVLRNALKHTPPGEIEVALYQGPVSSRGVMSLVIKVTDHGAGLPANWDTQKIRHAPESEITLPGTGFSLEACRKMIELAGGQLAIESKAKDGTSVSLLLKVQAVVNVAEARQAPTGLSILIVDDYPPALLLLQQQLSAMGYEVVSAIHGVEGLQRWQNSGEFSVIITDCTMPEMDGFEMTQRIREEEARRNLNPVPILGLTAMTGHDVTLACREAGMNACLTKPLSSNALQSLIRQFTSE